MVTRWATPRSANSGGAPAVTEARSNRMPFARGACCRTAASSRPWPPPTSAMVWHAVKS